MQDLRDLWIDSSSFPLRSSLRDAEIKASPLRTIGSHL